MCGIAGFFGNETVPEKEKYLDLMMNRIKHRGPDGEGKYADDKIALGHRRLSIIDLEGGKQPIFNEDGTKVIIFNGEIYNYKELKVELVKAGHKFSTKSDTEVILHGYEEYGEKVLKKLRGMFAFVIWDKKTGELFGARDFFGIKPFYYYKTDDAFMFASEIKAFIDHPGFKKEFNKDILPNYLSFNFTPTEETFFKNVYKLLPGRSFTFKDGKLKVKRYFSVSFDAKERQEDELIDLVEQTMKDSVRAHMVSDVEVGSFLSSGIDSSYIVALAKPDKTYTVGSDDERYDETAYAKDLSAKLGINNKSKSINREEYLNIIPKLMYHFDEPVADPAAIALYFVAQLAAQDVKVVLSGEGADEFFGGYGFYQSDLTAPFYSRFPYPIRRAVSKVAGLLPEHRGINYLVRAGKTLEEDFIGEEKTFSEKQARSIINFKADCPTNKQITAKVYREQKDKDKVTKMQAIDIQFWLVYDILQKADRMTMANSIEGRVPFTDIEVFRTARTIPYEAKIAADNTKIPLRKAAKRVIPTEAYNKKKLGFPVPLREWMREDDCYGMIKEKFLSDTAAEFFKREKLIKLLDDHKAKKCDNYKKVWAVYCFLVWYEDFFLTNAEQFA